jgi:hypothetical protein
VPLALLAAAVPVELDRDEARRAAAEELAKQVYREARPGLVERLLGWLADQLRDLLDGAAAVSPGGYVGLAVLLSVVVAGLVALRLRLGAVRRAAGAEQALFVGRERSADEHRAAADRHAAAGEWAEAVRDRLRAVVRSLEERSLLEPRPGRTADEAAAEAAAVLPSCAGGMAAAARVFDDVWYGGRPATSAHEQSLRELDQQVRSARPGPARAGRAGR